MSNLTAANLARLNATLDKQYMFNGIAGCFRDQIANGIYASAVVETVASVVYNRRKWNRMGPRQQAEYKKKLGSTKLEYRLYLASDHERFRVVPKMVFEYFITHRGSRT